MNFKDACLFTDRIHELEVELHFKEEERNYYKAEHEYMVKRHDKLMNIITTLEIDNETLRNDQKNCKCVEQSFKG